MCWNRESSLITGTTSVALSSFLLWRNRGNDVPIALISLAVSLMQFAEAFMWEGITAEEPEKGTLGGKLGTTALFLQPLILGTACLYFGGFGLLATGLFAVLGLLVSAPLYRKMMQKEWRPPATVGRNGHLEWLFTADIRGTAFGVFYWITMLGAWFLLTPRSEGAFYAIIAAVSVFLTIQFYPGEWGSMWCFLANLLPVSAVFFGR